jgi:CBS domain-containing protein
MDPAPIRITAQTTLLEAMALMREHAATALPVVQDDRLVGLVTERDLLAAAEQMLRSRADGGGG